MASGNVNLAALHEPSPTGEGAVVLEMVVKELDGLIAGLPEELAHKAGNITTLRRDLVDRAEVGKTKYGTYLRVNNGRRAIVDLYQEVADAIMYCAQCKMEGDEESGQYLPRLFFLGQELAGMLERRAKAAGV